MGSNGEEEEEGGHSTIQPDFELCATPCDEDRFRTTVSTTLHPEESDETIESWRQLHLHFAGGH
eukprot:5105949-Amphidinium_carterae.1